MKKRATRDTKTEREFLFKCQQKGIKCIKKEKVIERPYGQPALLPEEVLLVKEYNYRVQFYIP